MKRAKDIKEIKVERPPRAKVSEKEALKRMQEFSKRKEKFVEAVRGEIVWLSGGRDAGFEKA